MSSRRKRTFLAFAIVLFIPIGFYLFFEIKKHKTGIRLKKLPVLSQTSLPEFKFIAHTGDTITRQSVKNKILVVDFFYTTCPGICKSLSREMKELQDYIIRQPNLTSDYLLLSHTVDPETDSLPVLREYAELYDVNPRIWLLATGNKKEIYDLAVNFYKLPVVEIMKDTLEPFVHSERMVLVDKEGYIRGYYDGTDPASVKELMKDIVMLDINYEISKKK